jgi:hypothetical protein
LGLGKIKETLNLMSDVQEKFSTDIEKANKLGSNAIIETVNWTNTIQKYLYDVLDLTNEATKMAGES